MKKKLLSKLDIATEEFKDFRKFFLKSEKLDDDYQRLLAIIITEPKLNEMRETKSLKNFADPEIIKDIQNLRNDEEWTETETYESALRHMRIPEEVSLMERLEEINELVGGKSKLQKLLEKVEKILNDLKNQ